MRPSTLVNRISGLHRTTMEVQRTGTHACAHAGHVLSGHEPMKPCWSTLPRRFASEDRSRARMVLAHASSGCVLEWPGAREERDVRTAAIMGGGFRALDSLAALQRVSLRQAETVLRT